MTKHRYLNNPPGISINQVTLEYRGHVLFNQFSLDLPSGSWTCLLGVSGVGKSTLLKLLAGLPTGVDRRLIDPGVVSTSDQQPLTDRVAYMAQQDLLMPWLSVLENCLIGYRLRGEPLGPEEHNRALHLLHRAGLDNALHLRVSHLSGGMRQRVALVRTLLEERPVVLMDEPFSALDVITRLKLQDLAAEWLGGKTVLQVTHDPLEALRLGDRIVVLLGAPAQPSQILTLHTTRPRSPQDTDLLEKQATLLKLLAGSESIPA